jgi:hypothetical protein
VVLEHVGRLDNVVIHANEDHVVLVHVPFLSTEASASQVSGGSLSKETIFS